ncbi:MAG TPA: transglutaminase family protein [Planctomycetota bacterium]|nr:transglutaminase family protein [Planctomycetota bacterium]
MRTLHIKHVTAYRYDQPVNKSVHRLHLRPVHDFKQSLREHELKVSVENTPLDYEDVFGNATTLVQIAKTYTELTIESNSTVEIKDTDPFAFARVPIKRTFPLAWMPWEQTMLAPYLQPIELPDTQLEELFEYAMSFVQRCSGDLMETLFAINLALNHEYVYTPGSTTVDTTPFDVFQTRKGVCQDFANLFICLARLLGLPARYVCGYIFTGNSPAKVGSDATHAWLELYIPKVGWKAFDPTNGVLPNTDHVRVAYGRHYLDASPTSGTIYCNANESLQVSVEVADLPAAQ